jgi:hypothetical protein
MARARFNKYYDPLKAFLGDIATYGDIRESTKKAVVRYYMNSGLNRLDATIQMLVDAEKARNIAKQAKASF